MGLSSTGQIFLQNGGEPFDAGGRKTVGRNSGRDFTENKIRFATMCLGVEGAACKDTRFQWG